MIIRSVWHQKIYSRKLAESRNLLVAHFQVWLEKHVKTVTLLENSQASLKWLQSGYWSLAHSTDYIGCYMYESLKDDKRSLNFIWEQKRSRWRALEEHEEGSKERFCHDNSSSDAHYWANTRFEKRFLFTRASGGQGHVIWIGIRKKSKPKLLFVERNLNSETSAAILTGNWLHFIEDKRGGKVDESEFQYGYVPAHLTIRLKNLFFENVIALYWTGNSLEFNVIENVWALIADEF